MQTCLSKFRLSAKENRSVLTLCVCAMLIALNLLLDRVSIQVTPSVRIGVGFLTNAVASALYGPVVGMWAGAATDILSCIFYPRGAYFPGYTLTAIVAGLIYGLVLYQNKKGNKIYHAFIARGLISLICNIGLNTIWSSIFLQKAVFVLLPARALKNLALWPLESLLLYAVLVVVQRAVRKK